MVYANSDTDMLVAMPLPLTDLYKDGLSPWTECAKLAQLDPDRTVMWGTVNPLEGKDALDDVTRQVEEYGAKAFKFYNVRYEDGGQVPWRMDDPKVAFPVFERIQELGVNLIGVHKGVPLGPQMIEHTQTWDMDGAAGAFPDINFVIYHVGLPFIDETCWQLIRYPNLYASLAASINFVVRAPAAVRRAAREAAVLVRRGQDRLRQRGADLAAAVGARGVLELPDPAGPHRRLRLPAAHRAGQEEDPRREPAAPARHGRRGDPGPAGRLTPRRVRRAAGRKTDKRALERVRADRLGDEVVHADPEAAGLLLGGDAGGHRDDGRTPDAALAPAQLHRWPGSRPSPASGSPSARRRTGSGPGCGAPRGRCRRPTHV